MLKPAPSGLLIENGRITYINGVIEFTPDQVIYEVVRVETRRILFVDDHLARLYNGVTSIKHQVSISRDALKTLLIEFVSVSGVVNGNIKIEFFYSNNSVTELYYKAGFIPTSYPDYMMYKNGVACNFLEATRDNPPVKIANSKLRSISDSVIEQEKIFETLLVNNEGIITEGSRSNFFMIKSGVIYTAPDHLVLPGIMRHKVLEVIRDSGIPLELTAVGKNEVHFFDGCFITGTSPKVLPINTIEDYVFDVPHPITSRIMSLINNLVAKELKKEQ